MKSHGMSLIYLLLAGLAAAMTAQASELSGEKTVMTAKLTRDAFESWTCVIDRPKWWYVGWAIEEADARDQAVKACTDNGDVCTPDEAVCTYDDET